jgi:hypothetical protein
MTQYFPHILSGMEQGAGQLPPPNPSHGKKPKMLGQNFEKRPPPPEKKVTSGPGHCSQNCYTTPVLIPSDTPCTFKISDAKSYLHKKLRVMNYNDLTVKNGRLINNRPNDKTGIQQAAEIKKAMKTAEKIDMMAQAVAIGTIKAEVIESMNPRMRD